MKTLRYMALALLLVFGVAACDDAAESQSVNLEDIQELQSGIDDIRTSLEDLEAGDDGVAPQEILGQEVTVNGAVESVLSDNLLTVTGDDFWQFLEFEAPILVSVADGVPDNVEEGDVVQMTGTVDTFVIAVWEDAYGIDFDDTLVVDFENELAIANATVEEIELDSEG